jgi:hypothetical protein
VVVSRKAGPTSLTLAISPSEIAKRNLEQLHASLNKDAVMNRARVDGWAPIVASLILIKRKNEDGADGG